MMPIFALRLRQVVAVALNVTWDPAKKGAGVALSSGNNLATAGAGATGQVLSTTGYTAGKYYWEVVVGGPANQQRSVGLSRTGGAISLDTDLGQEAGEYGWYCNNSGSSNSYFAGAFGAFTGANYTTGDVIGMAVDFTLRRIWWHINGVYVSGNPATGTTPRVTYATGLGTMYAAASSDAGGDMRLRTKAADFTYPIPAGFTQYG